MREERKRRSYPEPREPSRTARFCHQQRDIRSGDRAARDARADGPDCREHRRDHRAVTLVTAGKARRICLKPRGLQDAAVLCRPVRRGRRAGKDGHAGYHRALHHQHERRISRCDRRHHALDLRDHQRLCGQHPVCGDDDPGDPVLPPRQGMDVAVLAWALSIGTDIGGNADAHRRERERGRHLRRGEGRSSDRLGAILQICGPPRSS